MALTSPIARTVRRLPWLTLVVWLAVALFGGDAFSEAIADRSDPVRGVAIAGAWVGWAVAAIALAVTSPVSLTITRSIVPASVPVAVVCWIAGADTASAVVLLLLAGAATLLTCTAEFGNAMVQASAYGDETRLPLRPPFAYLMLVVISWVVLVAMVIAGPLLIAAGIGGPPGAFVAGVVLTVLAAIGAYVFPSRWHILSRRWLVFVPAGLAVHDHLVLAETAMLRRAEIGSIGLALADTQALDLTGPATGHAIEITAPGSTTIIKAATTRHGSVSPIHATAILISPSRPGRALAEAARRTLPVRA